MFSGERLAGLRGVAARGGGCDCWLRAVDDDELDGAAEDAETAACVVCCCCCCTRCFASEGAATTT